MKPIIDRFKKVGGESSFDKVAIGSGIYDPKVKLLKLEILEKVLIEKEPPVLESYKRKIKD
jgi:hypothetical protein